MNILTHSPQPRRAAAALLAAILLSAALACVTVDSRGNGKPLTARQMDRIQLGMSMDEVRGVVGYTPTFTVPILHYPAPEGKTYLFYFMPTNEVPPSRDAKGQIATELYAITLLDEEADPAGTGVYVRPTRLRGQRCGGIIYDVQNAIQLPSH